MGKVTKTFVSKIRSINEKDFSLEAVVSDETVDRYGEVIRVDAWKKRLGNYKSHPVLVTSHNYGKLTNQIGYAEKVSVKDGELVCKFKYFVGEGNEEADWGWKLASKFGQAAYSVGFLPFDYERAEEKDYEEAKMGKKPFLTYTDVELLEVSQVLVPANPSALAKGMENEEDLVVKEYSESVLKDIDKMYKSEEVEDFLGFIKKDLGDGIVTKPETTEKYHHVPAPGEEGKHSDHKMRTITVSKDQGIKGVYCVDCKKIASYMFSTDKWTMDEAKEWVKEHSKAYEYFGGDFEIGNLVDPKNGEIYVADCIVGLRFPGLREPEDIKNYFRCFTYGEEEEEMREIVGEIKSYIDEKLKPIDEFIKSYNDEENEFKKLLEDETNKLREKETKEKEVKEEDDVSYIKTMIDEINGIAKKHTKE